MYDVAVQTVIHKYSDIYDNTRIFPHSYSWFLFLLCFVQLNHGSKSHSLIAEKTTMESQEALSNILSTSSYYLRLLLDDYFHQLKIQRLDSRISFPVKSKRDILPTSRHDRSFLFLSRQTTRFFPFLLRRDIIVNITTIYS